MAMPPHPLGGGMGLSIKPLYVGLLNAANNQGVVMLTEVEFKILTLKVFRK